MKLISAIMIVISQSSYGLIEAHGSTVRWGSSGSSTKVIASRMKPERSSSGVRRETHLCSRDLHASSKETTTPAAAATSIGPRTASAPIENANMVATTV